MSHSTTAGTNPVTSQTRGSIPFQSIIIFGILIVVYAPTIQNISKLWFEPEADMGHGILVPFVTAFILWNKRSLLRTISREPAWTGLILVVVGELQFLVATAANLVFLINTSFLVSLTGCVWAIFGRQMTRELAPALGVLLLMISPPTFLMARLTLPLQLLASKIAAGALETLGYSVLREGNILEMVGERLSVEEACSGIRALFSLFFFCLIYNYLVVRSPVVKWIILTAMIPVALLMNAGRIIITGVIGQYNQQLAHGFLHENLGYLTIFIAAGILIGLGELLQRLQIFANLGRFERV